MTSAAEYSFLIQIYGWIVGSLVVYAMLRSGERWMRLAGASDLPPPDSIHRNWERADLWFALGLVALISLLFLGSGTTDNVKDVGETLVQPSAMVMQLVLQVTLVGIVWCYLKFWRKLAPTHVFGLRRLHGWSIFWRALLGIFMAVTVIGWITKLANPWLEQATGLDFQEQMMVSQMRDGLPQGSMILMGLALCVGAPVWEELVFRGIFYSVARRFTDPIYAGISSAVFFAVIHQSVYAFVPLTLLGLAFATAYERTRCLWVPILMHAIFNTSQMLILTYGLAPPPP
jgi:membrane protease YdiL (CAAX protease family)